ncbi:hypothetical protein [Krasilnikovia cinnamomea]|nr:hypothetical protein [Krasilnikovia cinnamomea]
MLPQPAADDETAIDPASGCPDVSPGNSGQRWWIGAAITLFAALMILRGLVRAGSFADAPLLRHWYVQLAIGVAAAAGSAAMFWLLGRAYRRRH